MLSTLLALIPGGLKLIEYWLQKRSDVELAKVKARETVGSEAVKAAAEEAEGRSRTWGFISANKLLTLLVIGLAVPMIVFEWKVVVWDTVLGLGTTEPIKGQVADWMNTIIASMFSASTVAAIAQLWWTTKD